MIKNWIEAVRLRTLPVSVAGVAVACGYAAAHDCFHIVPALLCFLFALLAQVASNFANEYFDYRHGFDRRGRAGFRRGVTEGDISPKAMLRATLATLALAGIIGCGLVPFGGWKLLPIGILIAVSAMAYSAGPYPLSRIGLGDVAVLVFFGLVPVCLSFYVQSGYISDDVIRGAVAVGLMGVNVLVVNNYRDADDDRAVGKRTTVVRFGRKFALALYIIDGLAAIVLTADVWFGRHPVAFVVPVVYLILHVRTWLAIRRSFGSALNPLLGATARNMLIYSLLLVAIMKFM